MQLVAYGAQDIYLTGNPQITFFKVVYRRHTNFSMETISQTLDGNATIGTSQNESSCTISRNGDLIYKMYVVIPSAKSVGLQYGSEVVQSVELEIGGQLIDKHTKEWNNVWNELTLTNKYKSPVDPPLLPASPFPANLILVPSSTPLGIVTDILLEACLFPRPLQSLQGLLISSPFPLH